ncbi:sensor histidine kinase [Paenibacillus sp. GCM10027628]|uniref:sensor histidine kinase n=1 Tax=Paenibacillus sp. GCM10027628 TaxID=3273413 RepID=UPI00362AD2CC
MRLLKTSIRNRLFALLLLSTVIPIFTSIIITYFYNKESLKNRTIEENSLIINVAKTDLYGYVQSIINNSLTIYANPFLDRILSEQLPDYQLDSYVLASAQAIAHQTKDIAQVFQYYFINHRGYLLYQDNFLRKTYEFNPPFSVKPSPYQVYIESTHLSGDYGIGRISEVKQEPVFTVIRPLYKVPSTEMIGWLAIDVKLDALRSLASQMYNQKKEDLFILDEHGSVLYASDEKLGGNQLEEGWVEQILNSGEESGSLESKSSAFSGIMIYSKLKVASTEWTIVKRIPYNSLYQHARTLTWINTVVACAFLLLSIIAIYVVTIRFTMPIKQLIRRITKIESGQLDEPIDINREDEIGILAQRFRMMMHTINDLILREYKLNLANKTNQLNMLQAQINPHFMNNALQSIGHTALESDAPNVYALISTLGQMMHYSMDTNQTVVSVMQELDYVKQYLLLQSQRFEDKLQVKYDIDPASLSVQIPKMIVQPIVENFFKHGFNPLAGVGQIHLQTFIDEHRLVLIVRDNGTGIPKERLQLLRSEIAHIANDSIEPLEGIGLKNVMLRLQLYYGDTAELDLSECEPSGLQVQIAIPVEGIVERA